MYQLSNVLCTPHETHHSSHVITVRWIVNMLKFQKRVARKKEIIKSLAREKKRIRRLQYDIEQIRGKKCVTSIHRFLHSIWVKDFHQILALKLWHKNVDDYMFFFIQEQILVGHMISFPNSFSEFFIYEDRRPIFKDRF